MNVLVAYASRHGSTRGIAERIGEQLQAAGFRVEVLPAREVRNPERYSAFVVGGAAYMFHWLGDAAAFVRRNRTLLAGSPTWLFSSGPLGPDRPGPDGSDPRVTCEPREWRELVPALHPNGTRVFFGAHDPTSKAIGFTERLARIMPASKAAMPVGDFREWPVIEAWADGIARVLAATG